MNSIKCDPLLKPALRFLFLLLFLALVPGAWGASYNITDLDIQISVSEDGNTSVVEKFYLSFPSDFLRATFEERTKLVTPDLFEWKRFDSNFSVHVGGEDKIQPFGRTGSVLFTRENERWVLQFAYKLAVPAVEAVQEESRWTDFRLQKFVLSEFVSGPGKYSVPENTQVRLILPRNASEVKVDEGARVEQEQIVWRGFQQGSEFKVEYRLFKQIAPLFSIATLTYEGWYRPFSSALSGCSGLACFSSLAGKLTEDSARMAALALIAILGFVLVVRRKELEARIVEFVEKNSESGELKD